MTEQTSFTPSGPPRPNQVYLSRNLARALRYAAKREDCTVEDLFESVLNEYLHSKHPDIIQWVEARDLDEKNFVKSLKPAMPDIKPITTQLAKLE